MRAARVPADPKQHRDYIAAAQGGAPVAFRAGDVVYTLDHRGARLVFISLSQVREARDWFMAKTHPATRAPHPPGEHFWQPWHGRLPKPFLGRAVRPKIVAALDKLLKTYG